MYSCEKLVKGIKDPKQCTRQYATGNIKHNPNPDTKHSYFGNINMYHIISDTLDGKKVDEDAE